MRVLIVEDEKKVAKALREGLEAEHYAVRVASSGEEGFFLVNHETFDCVVLDLMLPHRDGLEILATVRKRGLQTPVLILTARDTVADRVRGLDSGADDYLVKPFALEELAARMRALLRRHSGRAEPLITYGDLTLNPVTHHVTWRGAEVALASREFAVLQALLERPGAVLSRTQLEERLYGWEEEVASNAVEVHIHHLRHKLDPVLIRTVRGVGYMVPEIP